MATGLDFYERQEEYIGVSVGNPAVGADVAKALAAAFARYQEFHGKQAADDSIKVIADESGIFFEFRGSTGVTGAGGRE